MTNTSFTTADLQRKSGEITDTIAAGQTVTLTRYRKPFAQIVPAKSALLVPEDLRGPIEEYAAANGIDAAEALHRLVFAALQAAPAEPTMWDLFPEADRTTMTTSELSDLIQEEATGEGEAVEYEWNGRHAQHYYSKVRGQWFYEFSERVGGLDAERRSRWEYTWTLCGSKKEAKRLYRDAIIAASADWDPAKGDGMWSDAWDVTFTEFVKLGDKSPVPLASFGGDVES
jgi:antitoxin (DNA-binding transcriptional repressor) of toxin-antitoxin stability system